MTGGNRGIGFETARQLGAKGYTVLIGARDEKKGQEAAALLKKENINAEAIVLDVTNEDTIKAAAQQIDKAFGSLNVLINNAGINVDNGKSPSQLALDELQKTFETNVFGTFAVTKALLPLIKKSSSGRIVNLSSSLGSLTLNSDPESGFFNYIALAYMSSKAAVNALTILFAKELKDFPIKVNSADPGYTATDLTGYVGHPVAEGASIVVHLATLTEDGPTGGFFDKNGIVPW
ncbi:SDR family oxidoreductase [Scopulibacillus daqui]|uniref:SDR family oxidoreductase n=1 Tax=Scopulibacillus daqui TaxID=1469162 RepID=UPI0030842A83